MTRTLDEIVETVRSGETPDADDLFYAVAALSHLLDHTSYELIGLIEKGHPALSSVLDSHSARRSGAGGRPPALWLGPDNDPRCPDYQEWRRQQADARRKLLH